MRRRLTLVIVCLLAACAAPQRADERYMADCTARGLEPESDLWHRCIEEQRAVDLMEAERIRNMRGLRPGDR